MLLNKQTRLEVEWKRGTVDLLQEPAWIYSALTISQPFGTSSTLSAEPSPCQAKRDSREAKAEMFADQIKIVNININGFRSKEAQIRRFISNKFVYTTE